jgi:hypothetical protein
MDRAIRGGPFRSTGQESANALVDLQRARDAHGQANVHGFCQMNSCRLSGSSRLGN